MSRKRRLLYLVTNLMLLCVTAWQTAVFAACQNENCAGVSAGVPPCTNCMEPVYVIDMDDFTCCCNRAQAGGCCQYRCILKTCLNCAEEYVSRVRYGTFANDTFPYGVCNDTTNPLDAARGMCVQP